MVRRILTQTLTNNIITISFCVFLGVSVVASPILAQDANILEETQANSEAELRELRRVLTNTKTKKYGLEEEISEINQTKKSVNQQLVEVAARMRKIENQMSRIESQLVILQTKKYEIGESLETQKKLLAQTIAAAQKLGRHPPPALLVTPEDALTSLRSAGLLAAIAPKVSQQTKLIERRFEEVREVTKEIKQKREELDEKLESLVEDETRLVYLANKKAEQVSKTKEQLEEEQERSSQLAARADSLEELIGAIQTRIQTAANAAKSAKEIEAKRQDEQANRLRQARVRIAEGEQYKPLPKRGEVGATKNQNGEKGRREIPFEDTIGLLSKPVNGKVIYAFGSKDDIGNKRQNVTFEARSRSWVSTPSNGWVVYAGPFRSYKKLVILGVGNGYHIIFSGMEHISVQIGDYVLAGEPIGRMGTNASANTVANVGASAQKNNANEPLFFDGALLYVEFRKGTKPIDPSPWWASVNEEDNKDDS